MKIKLTSVYVVDQEKALRFYTNVLGFVKKADFSQGPKPTRRRCSHKARPRPCSSPTTCRPITSV